MYKFSLIGATSAGMRINGVLHRRQEAECQVHLLGILASSSGIQYVASLWEALYGIAPCDVEVQAQVTDSELRSKCHKVVNKAAASPRSFGKLCS